MADNENKKNNTAEGAPRQGGRPPRRPYGKGHHRPHGPRKEQREEGAATAEQQQKKPQKRNDEQAKPAEKRPPRPKDQARPKQEPKKGERRRDDNKRKQGGDNAASQQPALSPRRRQMQELMTAEQKAFAEATDIMLDAEAKRQSEKTEKEEPENTVEIVGIRFKQTGKIYYFAPAGIAFNVDDGAIVETSRGQEYGFVVLANRMVDEKETVQPLKPVIRKATAEDTEKYKKNKEQEQRAATVWEQLVAKHKLTMSLTDIEYTFDNSKLIFYFTAEGRVDFRELVKDLAAVFRTRIELRQIGVRDEAKLLGGLGVCGMPFCCHRFLSDFVQVSIKMAKEQNLSLSSSKISGNCGRLMCCLRYEQDVYDMEYTTFPKSDMIVRTAQGTGVVVESNFLNGKIKVRMDNGEGSTAIKTFTRDEVKVIGKAKHREAEVVDSELKALED